MPNWRPKLTPKPNPKLSDMLALPKPPQQTPAEYRGIDWMISGALEG